MTVQGLFKRVKGKIAQRIFFPRTQISYSQFGEDLILAFFFSQRGIEKPSYLDIGANEPKFISNTYYFHERGSRGVLVEPNPVLAERLRRQRKGDVIIQAGIGFGDATEADFYRFPDSANGLSTFSKEEAMHWETVGMKGIGKIKPEKIERLPLIPINNIMTEYFSAKAPDFVSLDVEGLDLQILQDLDFERFQPLLFCVETFIYDEHQAGKKNEEIIQFMFSKGYRIYADTGVNSIFIHSKAA